MKQKLGITLAGQFAFEYNTDSINFDYSHIAFSCNSSEFEALKSKLIEYGCYEWSKNESEGESFYFLDPDGNKLEIHVGDLQSRLTEMKNNSLGKFEYYT